MDRIDIKHIDPIDSKDLSIILDCEIQDKTGNTVPLNDISVVISVFDTTDNFIEQKIISGYNFRYNFQNESQLLNYIYNIILNIDGNEDLNPGKYKLKFSFIVDTFNSVENENNRFVVTEISPDNTEIRLNPLSNGQDFIDIFSRIKNHKKSDKKIELNEQGFIKFYRDYINSVFSDESISNIFSDNEVKIGSLPLSAYLTEIYKNRSNADTDEQKQSEGESKASNSIDKMKSELLSKKGDALIFISKYFESYKDELFTKLNNISPDNAQEINFMINEFKIKIKNKMNEFLVQSINKVVDSVLRN